MQINKEIIENYTDFLASTHDSLVGDVHRISSKLAEKIAQKTCTFLEDKKHLEKCSIVLPCEDDIKRKIEGTIKDYFFSSIENIEEFIRKQNSSIDSCIEQVASQLLIDIEHFSYDAENNRSLLDDQEKPTLPIDKIIDSVITHINFRNESNQEYHLYENMVESHIKGAVPVVLEQGKNSFEETKEGYKQRLNNKTYQLFSNINEIKTDSIGEQITEESENAKQFK